MKRNYFVFILLALMCLCITSCAELKKPADAEVIGSGHIQHSNGVYFVEIDSTIYPLEYMYTNSYHSTGKDTMKAVEGMVVTCFRLHGNSKVEFIIGTLSQEYLEEYFTEDTTGAFIFAIFFISGVTFMLIDTNVKKTSVHSD